jgi:uncharacterized membrane protein YfcA
LEYGIVCATALLAAALTLFSGFGLGTLLLPVLALFFPVEVAVSATAVVHLLNNLFKIVLVGRKASGRVLAAFGIPAAIAALAGAWALTRLSSLPIVAEYAFAGRMATVTPVKLCIAALIFVFAWFDLLRPLRRLAFPPRWIPLGGALSGLFGGLSGHQGALRSAFLLKAGLSKERFIGTGAACAVLVDLSRLAVYGSSFFAGHFATLSSQGGYELVAAAAGAAFVGSFVGSRLVRKVTLEAVQKLVGALLLLVSIALGSGLL